MCNSCKADLKHCKKHEGSIIAGCERNTVPLPDPLGVGGVWHVSPRGLLHGLLVELVFGERCWTKWTDPERGGDADFRHGRLGDGRSAGRCRWGWEDIYGRNKKVKELVDDINTVQKPLTRFSFYKLWLLHGALCFSPMLYKHKYSSHALDILFDVVDHKLPEHKKN